MNYSNNIIIIENTTFYSSEIMRYSLAINLLECLTELRKIKSIIWFFPWIYSWEG